jgi:hypothetical protein
MASPLDILHQLYPQARVTSARRDPNSALGRANPRSYHNVGQAFDVAPIPGVNFGDYVSSLKGKGVNVIEALDEQAHPKPWTTGPNWHIAFGAPQVAKKPRSLADIMTNPIPESFAPNIGANPDAQAPMTLADLALPQGDIPQKKKSPFTAGNILGVLGDALMAYGGLQPQFGPNLVHQRDEERQMAFDREKLNAMLEQKRQEALAPPQWLQDAMTFQGLPQGQRDAVLGYQDAVHPIFTATPQGTMLNKRLQGSTKTINGVTYYNVNGDWYDNPEGR